MAAQARAAAGKAPCDRTSACGWAKTSRALGLGASRSLYGRNGMPVTYAPAWTAELQSAGRLRQLELRAAAHKHRGSRGAARLSVSTRLRRSSSLSAQPAELAKL